MTSFLESFIAARKAAIPIVGVVTPDPAATMAGIAAAARNGSEPPILCWDIARGLFGCNEPGASVVQDIAQRMKIANPSMLTNPVDVLKALAWEQKTQEGEEIKRVANLPARSLVFFFHHRQFFDQPSYVQAVWNVRDLFKEDKRTLILLANSLTLPSSLEQDVVILEEEYPTRAQLAEIVTNIYESSQESSPDLKSPSKETLERAVDRLSGLPAFTAEQITAMCMDKENGVNLDALTERQRIQIQQTRGCSLWRGKESEIAGCENYIDFMDRFLEGPMRPGALVLLDEMGDALAGNAGDNTGVSQDMHGAILTFMENNKIPGALSVGVPGVGKSYGPKVLANRHKIPLLIADLGAMKEGVVGKTAENVRAFLKVAMAISGGRFLFIGTTNSTANITPQLMSRFRFTFFWDVPTKAGREQAWKIYMQEYKLKAQKFPNDDNWTPREIRNCCETAYSLGSSLEEGAKLVVPVYRSGADDIAKLRSEADGKYIDVNKSGFYEAPKAINSVAGKTRRAVD